MKISQMTLVALGASALFMTACNIPGYESTPKTEEEKNIMDKKDDMMDKKDDMMDKKDDMMDKKDDMMDKKDDMMDKKDDMMDNTNKALKTEDSSTATETEPMKKVAEYEEYAEIALDAALESNKKVVLFFHASRCPSCRTADKDITKNIADLPSDVVVLKVDYDKEKALKQKYGVTSQHTFVEIDKNKNKVAQFSGGGVSKIQKLFAQ